MFPAPKLNAGLSAATLAASADPVPGVPKLKDGVLVFFSFASEAWEALKLNPVALAGVVEDAGLFVLPLNENGEEALAAPLPKPVKPFFC